MTPARLAEIITDAMCHDTTPFHEDGEPLDFTEHDDGLVAVRLRNGQRFEFTIVEVPR